jgi:hypothetical protein
MLVQDGRAQQEVLLAVVKKENPNGLRYELQARSTLSRTWAQSVMKSVVGHEFCKMPFRLAPLPRTAEGG